MHPQQSPASVDDFLLDFAPYAALPQGLPIDRGAIEYQGGVRFVQADSQRGEVPYRDTPEWPDYVAILGADDVPQTATNGGKIVACVVPLALAFAVGYMIFGR